MSTFDWIIVVSYLLFAFLVGFYVRKQAGSSVRSYFIANGELPWWWAGASIAATTFAADTPLAVTGLIANSGFSGNLIWLSWIAVHVGIVVFFAQRWNRASCITDAEFIRLRYGNKDYGLRLFRAFLYGIVFNCIILAWVLRAMVKIISPIFQWEIWTPSLFDWIQTTVTILPAGYGAGDFLSTVLLLTIVAIYSSSGGIRGVIFTDLIQLFLSILGSYWFAYTIWEAVGGISGLTTSMNRIYSSDHTYFDVMPKLEDTSAFTLFGMIAFPLYLFVQSFANLPADGGGYVMQRLSAAQSPKDAKKAAMLFVVIQYLVRTWPWFIVAFGALVLIPIGSESEVFSGRASAVGTDRELAYAILLYEFLPSGLLGLMVVSLLAAFMSTVDTHINWGASYIVNDFLTILKRETSVKTKILISRISVVGFACLALILSMYVPSIELAWRWLASLGAALGFPTLLRWFWWRVRAFDEFVSIIGGLLASVYVYLSFDDSYQLQLIFSFLGSIVALGLSLLFGRAPKIGDLQEFYKTVSPVGIWPLALGRERKAEKCSIRILHSLPLKYFFLLFGIVTIFFAIYYFMILNIPLMQFLLIFSVGFLLSVFGYRERD